MALYRAYDANLARWISRDPIGENGGPNLYGYVQNNPLNLTDPLGLDNVSNDDICGATSDPSFLEGLFPYKYKDDVDKLKQRANQCKSLQEKEDFKKEIDKLIDRIKNEEYSADFQKKKDNYALDPAIRRLCSLRKQVSPPPTKPKGLF